MFNGAVAIARLDGQIALVQVVQSNRTSHHVEVYKYTWFGDKTFLSNITSTPPICINNSDILQFMPSHIRPSGDTLMLPNDAFSQYIACTTANQQEIEAKWERYVAGGVISR